MSIIALNAHTKNTNNTCDLGYNVEMGLGLTAKQVNV